MVNFLSPWEFGQTFKRPKTVSGDGPIRRNPVQRELNALGRKVVPSGTRYRRKPKHAKQQEKTEWERS